MDRQIAKIGAGAFQKAWRRTQGKAVLLSCHYDVLDWIEPDWIFDTFSGQLERGRLRRRPRLELEIFKTDGAYWPAFEKHHYLKLPRPIAATYFVGFVEGEAVAHVAVTPRLQSDGMRACRLVVMPEWQGAGIGLRFLTAVASLQFDAAVNAYATRTKAFYINTSHPGLCAALRRDDRWIQISQNMGGVHKGKSGASINKSKGRKNKLSIEVPGYGGHHRAIQGFKMKNPNH